MRNYPVLLFALCAALCPAAELPIGTSLANEPLSPWTESAEADAIVFIFVAPDCPISNRYAPTIRRLAADCADHNIALWLVYADNLADAAAIRTNQTEFKLSGLPTVIDRDFAIADFAGADVTPEAAVFMRPAPESAPLLVYRGRIDDQYQGYNKYRPAPTASELRETLDTIIAGHLPSLTRTKAIGCYLPRP
ncbi:hypothetical protein [Actomonas aquatica]|uniref:Thioredoxin domain-containing protein n=1 Tax=Actomonas aquatica TaxID=2866162 RepID=A0ABZ1C7J4_9BACT|nr:hypothetical protein [Opitutus sp. WL0086]WRQ87436.1 hypothetical protein K1X11_021695 [Opitutus sp. WL0086]